VEIEDVVRRVADGESTFIVTACALQCGAEDLRGRLGELHVALRRRPCHQVADAEKLRIVLHLLGVAGRPARG
jgi:hypothetical protein